MRTVADLRSVSKVLIIDVGFLTVAMPVAEIESTPGPWYLQSELALIQKTRDDCKDLLNDSTSATLDGEDTSNLQDNICNNF